MGAKWGESQQRTQQKDNEASEFQPSPSVYESYTRALQEANEILSHEESGRLPDFVPKA